MMDTYEKKSFQSHETHYQNVYTDPFPVLKKIHNWEAAAPNEYYTHYLSWRLTDALTQKPSAWLTIGDGYGADAAYLKKHLAEVLPTDISKTMLEAAQSQGYIKDFAIENVEKISFADKSFDYVYCKESYHHFPRPFMGLYEMIRVCKKAVVIQEPVDIIMAMPVLVFLKNLLDRINPNLLKKIWKNQYSFETVGNFVYKVSEREFEKAAIAIGLPAIAFKGYNHYKNNAVASSLTKIKRMVAIRDFFCKISFLPYEQLSTIIFRELPDSDTIKAIKKQGYKYIQFPSNPYTS